MSTLIQNIQNRAVAFQNALKAASDVHTHLTGYSYKLSTPLWDQKHNEYRMHLNVHADNGKDRSYHFLVSSWEDTLDNLAAWAAQQESDPRLDVPDYLFEVG
jgi:hypothetical protein